MAKEKNTTELQLEAVEQTFDVHTIIGLLGVEKRSAYVLTKKFPNKLETVNGWIVLFSENEIMYNQTVS